MICQSRLYKAEPMGKMSYLQRCLVTQFSADRFLCPNCGHDSNVVVERKIFVTQLRRCMGCQLLFRTPTDDPRFNSKFYENEYNEGFTTELPIDEELAKLKDINFVGGEKDYSYYIGVLEQLGLKPGAKIFDFGCSWGYGSYQIGNAGFEVAAYEVAHTRRNYAIERLQVNAFDDMKVAENTLRGQVDCFFSSHVLEHVPSPAQAFGYAMSLLKSGGLFVAFVPNGSEAYKRVSPSWNSMWGEVHPNYIDDLFLDNSFRHSPRIIGSSPVQNASRLGSDIGIARLDALDRGELFFAARKVGEEW